MKSYTKNVICPYDSSIRVYKVFRHAMFNSNSGKGGG